jgi:hypothetical protein
MGTTGSKASSALLSEPPPRLSMTDGSPLMPLAQQPTLRDLLIINIPIVSLVDVITVYMGPLHQHLIAIGDPCYDWSPLSIGWISSHLPCRPSQTIITTQPLSHHIFDFGEVKTFPVGTSMVADDQPGYRRIFGTFPLTYLMNIAIIDDRLYAHGFTRGTRAASLISIPVIDLINQVFEYNDRMPITSLEDVSRLLKWKCDHAELPMSIRDPQTQLVTCVWRQRLVFVGFGLNRQCYYYGILH